MMLTPLQEFIEATVDAIEVSETTLAKLDEALVMLDRKMRP